MFGPCEESFRVKVSLGISPPSYRPNQRQAGRPGKMEVTSQTHGQTLSMRDRPGRREPLRDAFSLMQLWSYMKISDVTTWDEEMWPYWPKMRLLLVLVNVFEAMHEPSKRFAPDSWHEQNWKLELPNEIQGKQSTLHNITLLLNSLKQISCLLILLANQCYNARLSLGQVLQSVLDLQNVTQIPVPQGTSRSRQSQNRKSDKIKWLRNFT